MDISFKWGHPLFVRLGIVFVILTTMIAILPARHVFAQMTETRNPTTNIVIDGNARFTVLTPMVIRLEYANDGNFQNGTTFNVINRTFPIPNYSTQVVNGWREISTDDLTLRYKEGSGMFSPTNLTMLLKGQSKMVIPDWGQATFTPCTFAQNCETENAFLSGGAAIATDHQNYSGTGFVGGYQQSGSSATWVVHDSPLASSDTLSIRYANATGGDGLNETRTLDLYVNGTNTGAVSFPTTANWDSWSTVKQKVTLQKGDNTLALVCDPGNSCNINVDSTVVSEVCVLGQVCQAENAALSGGASIATDHQMYTGTGFVAGYEQAGATTTWTVQGVPQAGNAVLTIRYANFLGSDSQTTTTRTLDLSVNGSQATQLSFPPTMSWDSWQTVTQTVALAAGNNTIALAYDASNSGKINLDSIAITSPGAALPLMTPANMGGWARALDGANGAVTMNNGLLSQDGWYLLDDTSTALWNGAKSWPAPRPSHTGAYQDGYLFGYGHQYEAALQQLAQLTGSAPLLPRWAFGNWYSRYYPYTANDYEQTILPKFRSEQVPLDVLVTDTDWKAPTSWNGWNWNTSDFPDPQAYLTWAKSQGLHATLNIHPSIQGDDPQFAAANSAVGGLINDGSNRYVWDWSNQQQAASYFALHQPFDQQGVRFWWLDWCCDNSRVSMSGLNPDGWINYLYAQDAINQNLRGFAFSRMGSSYTSYAASSTVPSGPWSNHRSTVQFTGDTYPSWNMLSFEAAFSTMEGNIGQPYVTHDIGSFHGGHLADDLYVRWVQFGTFQPILRLHSDHGDRLPWNYDDTARVPAEQFMRLRESLTPYLYTLSWQAATTGLPMTRGLYLTYPEAPEAYQYDREYMLGDQMLVAPITSAGITASTRVWLPPGTWTDYFTGKSYTGPSVQTITDNLSQMPVFIKAGGIIPTQPYMDYASQKPVDPLNLSVYAGAPGSYTLYEDSGEGLSYQKGQSAQTTISYDQSSLNIGAEQGSYTGQLSQRGYNIAIINVASAPSTVTVNGQPLSQTASGEGWTYDATARTVHIQLNKRSTQTALNIKLS